MDMYYSGMSFRKIADHLVRFFPKGVHASTIYWDESKMNEEIRVTTSLKIKPSIRDKFKVYCIEKKIDMSELLEKLIEKEVNRKW